MEFSEARITKKGHGLLAKMHAGEPLTVTRVHCGDGVYDGDAWDLNDLISLKLEGSIIAVTPKPREQYTTFHVRFTNETVKEFFMLREVGIYALDPDEGEILYAYAQAGDRANFVEAYNGQWYTEDELFFNVYTASVANIDAKIEQTGYAAGIRYDNALSGLEANNLQAAIDELVIMHPVDCVIKHNLECYPKALVLETTEGYDIRNYGEGLYGGGSLREIKSTAVYDDLNTMRISMQKKVYGTPDIARAGRNGFILLYPDTTFFLTLYDVIVPNGDDRKGYGN